MTPVQGTSSGATASQADHKAAAAAPPPIAARTAAAVAASLTALQTEAKGNASSSQEKDPKEAVADALKLVPIISKAFYIYDKTLLPDAHKCLSLADLLNIAQNILFALPAKAQPELALRAYRQLVKQSFSSAPNGDAEQRQVSTYTEFCKACQYPATALMLPFRFTMRGYKYTNVFRTAPVEPTAMPQRLAMRAMIFNLIRDEFEFLERFWQQADAELQAAFKEYQQQDRRLSRVKKVEKSNPTKGLFTAFNGAEAFYNQLQTLLPQLRHYTHKRFLEIRTQCLCLDLSGQDVCAMIETLHSTVSTSNKYVIDICHLLNKTVSDFEASFALVNGHLPKSELAAQRQRKYWIDVHNCTRDAYLAFANAIDAYLKENSEDPENLKIVSKKQFSTFLKRVNEEVQGKLLKSKKAEQEKKEMGEEFSKIFDKFIVDLAKIKDKLSHLSLTLHKSNKVLKIGLEPFFPDYQNLDIPSQVPLRKALEIYHSVWLEKIDIRFDKIDKDATFKRWQMIVSGKSLRPAEFQDDDVTFINEAAQTIDIVNSVEASAKMLSNLFDTLKNVQDGISRELRREHDAKADACLDLLLLEENSAEAKRIAAEEEQKLQPSPNTHPGSVLVATSTPTPEPKPVVVNQAVALPVCFKNPAVQSLFEMRCAAVEFCGMNPAAVVRPSDLAGKAIPLSKIAMHQHIYAQDGFLAAWEMFSLAQPEDQLLLSDLLLHRGHLALEQCLTVEHAVRFPRSYLNHELFTLLQNLKMDQRGNPWVEKASGYSLYHRYLHNFSGTLPSALQHAKEGSQPPAQYLQKELPSWVVGLAEMQTAALIHRDPQNAKGPKIQALVDQMKAAMGKQQQVEIDRKMNSSYSSAQTKTLKECEKKLTAQIEPLLKIADDQVGAKALMNARHHLRKLLGVVRLIPQFPQQRFLHSLAHMLISSMKNFAENYGTYLSAQRGAPIYTHVLRDLPLKDALDGNSQLEATLQEIDIGKGDDYPYDYFAFHGAKASAVMHMLSDCYDLSQEALMLGDGAVRPKGKDLPALQAELVNMSMRFTNLVCALSHK